MQTLRITTQLQTTIPVDSRNEKKELLLGPPSWDVSSAQRDTVALVSPAASETYEKTQKSFVSKAGSWHRADSSAGF